MSCICAALTPDLISYDIGSFTYCACFMHEIAQNHVLYILDFIF